MLTAHDELMCHQLTTTFDHVDQSDLRWTERVVIYGFDRQTLTIVMTGMARYPNRNVIDAYAMVTVDGRAHVVRTSREISAAADGIASWQVGNYGYEVTEPLRQVRAVLEPGEGDLSLDLEFTGTFPCYEQAPAFFRDRGRVDEDARRFYQNGQASGSITLGDKRIAITPRGAGTSPATTRGESVAAAEEATWQKPRYCSHARFPRECCTSWASSNSTTAWCISRSGKTPTAASGSTRANFSTRFRRAKPSQAITHVEHDFTFRDDLRVVTGGEVVVHAADGTADTISITPVTNFWPGFAGYDEYRGYASGQWRGPSYADSFVVETTDPAELAKVSMLSETFCRVQSGDSVGHGLVEMVFMGRNVRYGYAGY